MAVYFSTLLELADVSNFRAQIGDLPVVRIGERLTLRFRLERMHLGRRESREVDGEYSVTGLNTTVDPKGTRQIVQVSAVGKAPAWRAVKLLPPRTLSPARWPPTEVK